MFRTLRAGLVWALMCISVSLPAAENFRMETDVLVGKETKPLVQTLTLFTDGLVYDFILNDEVGETTVFDMGNGRVTLLDPKRSVKTILSYEQLVKLTTAFKVHGDSEIFNFAADPSFVTTYDAQKKLLTLTGKPMIYRVTGEKPEQESAARRYQEFADWSARLNACRPGNLPPFARIELSRELAERGLIPSLIERTIVAPGRLGSKKLEVQSRHISNWILSTKDRQRIQTVADQIGTFEAVTFQKYAPPPKK